MVNQVKQNDGLRAVNRQGALQFDAVKECDPRTIATAGAFKIVVKDPFLSVLKEDSHKT
jgi:hypothetical protein